MFVFFFNDTATTEIYTLSLHDALPIYVADLGQHELQVGLVVAVPAGPAGAEDAGHAVERVDRSEEHTSELQSRQYLVCRLLLEKKNKIYSHVTHHIQHVAFTNSG